jgi:mercuric reductase
VLYFLIIKRFMMANQPKKLQLEIEGMTCEHCARSIENKLNKLDGVVQSAIDFKEGKGEVTYKEESLAPQKVVEEVNSMHQYKVKDWSEKSSDGHAPVSYDLIILGGGSAAFAAAIEADELEISTLIVNEGLPWGGTCVNVGCLPSKHLIRAAEGIHKASHTPFRGISPNPPSWDYKTIIRQKSELVKDMQQHKYMDVVADLENITMLKGKGRLSSRNTIEVDGKTYKGIKILIATGSNTTIPPIEGLNEIDYLTNDSLFDLEDLPESLTIIGGGYIGLEIAQAYHRFGSKVKVVEYFDHILNTQTEDVSDEVQKHLEEEGIEFYTGTKATKVYKEGSNIVLVGEQSGRQISIASTHLLIATGRTPNTKGIGLEETGVQLLKGGFVKVNEELETSVPGIYAIGDINPNPPFVYTAAYEGKTAVRNAFQSAGKQTDYQSMPWVIFTDPQVAGVGLDEKEAAAQGIAFEVASLPLSEVPRSAAALDTRGFIKLIKNPQTDQLLGGRVVAPDGGELIMELSLAVKYGIPVNDLADSFHPYLTLSEGIKLAAITFNKSVAKLSCCAS